tara:strand:- start:210 stop:563 length:354 start_codon:yes stop_codon:yes gene_type:complete
MANAKTNSAKAAPSPEELSKAELENKRRDISKYYKENIPHLKTQLSYEELLRDIEKTRAERLQAQMFIAQTMAPEPTETDDTPPVTNQQESSMRFDASKMDGADAAEQIKRSLKRSM